MHRFISYASAVLFTAVLALGLASCDGANSAFAGKYETTDTQGQPMTITLSEDGAASGTRAEEALTGSWKEEGGGVMITWSDDWATKIAKDGDKYTKTAYKGGTADGEPVPAKKVE
jgi:hypothetical protein